MDRYIFDEEHEMFRDSVRSFMKNEIEPHSDRWHEAGIVDREAFLKAGEMGFLLMWADEKYGGIGVRDFRYEQILIEENAHHGDAGFFMTLHSRLVGPYFDSFATEEQNARWLPKCISGEHILAIGITEPGAGSDVAGLRTKAEDKGDHFLLNGSKTYISNGILADLVIVVARTDPGNSHALSLFVVERGMEGFERGKNLKKMGLKSQDTAELFFNNVKVPKENLHMRTELDVGYAFVDRCVEAHNQGQLTAEDAAKAKLWTSELEGRVTDECVQLHGGAGYMDEYKVSRLYTNARVSRIYAGSSEIMREIIARSIGLDPRKRQKAHKANAA